VGHSPCCGVSDSPAPWRCPLEFVVLGAPWFLLCKQGVRGVGAMARSGTHHFQCHATYVAWPPRLLSRVHCLSTCWHRSGGDVGVGGVDGGHNER
jgi:hypothetical protein